MRRLLPILGSQLQRGLNHLVSVSPEVTFFVSWMKSKYNSRISAKKDAEKDTIQKLENNTRRILHNIVRFESGLKTILVMYFSNTDRVI
jgi:hypothetical protein